MVEGEATQDSAASEDAPASPPAGSQLEAGPISERSDESTAEATESHEPGSVEETPVEASAPERRAFDWSHLRGFQTVEAPTQETAARPEFAEELVKEIAARAARFARSVDESIVMSSDGLIRWLGDPVARVVSGEALLKPHAVLLADEALAGEERTAVETRVALWLAAHTRKMLGPLVALVEAADLADAARTLSEKIAESLGVLDRERVRAEVKGLDQTARAALRKLGVRFGSLYIYVPALLKPGARSLCSLLWTLRRGAETGADRLLAFASAGRTSFANEGLLSPDAYRVAGFRLCGERVVRVDIIERLSDLIRAAIPDHMRFGSRPPSEAYGFLVTPQMTSLTGCSGEAFASILRSLGFEQATVSKSAFEAANRKASTAPLNSLVVAEPVSVETPAETDDAASQVEASTEETAHLEAETQSFLDPDQTGGEGATTAEDSRAEVEQAPARIGDEAAEREAVEPAPSLALTSRTIDPNETEGEPASAEEGAIQAEISPLPEEERTSTEVAEAAGVGAGETTDGEAQSVSPPNSQATAVAGDETIEIWRPAQRRPRVQRPQGAERVRHGKLRDAKRHVRPQEAGNEAGRPTEAPATAIAIAAAQAAPAARTGPERRDDSPRRFESKGKEGGRPGEDRRPVKDAGRPREDRRPAKDFGPRRESRPVQVDPDSPFAKLAALKPLLERRDKRT